MEQIQQFRTLYEKTLDSPEMRGHVNNINGTRHTDLIFCSHMAKTADEIKFIDTGKVVSYLFTIQNHIVKQWSNNQQSFQDLRRQLENAKKKQTRKVATRTTGSQATANICHVGTNALSMSVFSSGSSGGSSSANSTSDLSLLAAAADQSNQVEVIDVDDSNDSNSASGSKRKRVMRAEMEGLQNQMTKIAKLANAMCNSTNPTL